MRLDKVIFATITWARTEDEERLLRAALSALSRYDRPIMVADGGSRPDFIDFLRALPNVTLVAPERPGLVGQTLSSLRAAFEDGADFIVYTESDKHHFFEHKLADFIEDAPDAERFGVGIAARDESSFATFPATQRATEGAINALFAREIALAADFCYGPLLLNRALIPRLAEIDPALGWGWRFLAMGLARRMGYDVRVFEAGMPCPPDQREDDAFERIHRMRQLSQNLQGVIAALQAPVSPS